MLHVGIKPQEFTSVCLYTLLSAVAQSPSLVGPCRPGSTVHTSQLAVLPYSHPKKKSHHIAQFFSVQLLNISVRAHLGSGLWQT